MCMTRHVFYWMLGYMHRQIPGRVSSVTFSLLPLRQDTGASPCLVITFGSISASERADSVGDYRVITGRRERKREREEKERVCACTSRVYSSVDS